MNLINIISELENGKSIRRKCWLESYYFSLDKKDINSIDSVSVDDFNANDWVVCD
jgi:hypothetical protein